MHFVSINQSINQWVDQIPFRQCRQLSKENTKCISTYLYFISIEHVTHVTFKMQKLDFIFKNEFKQSLITYILNPFKLIAHCIEPILSLWILGNFLKADLCVVFFLKPLKFACFLLAMIDRVANRLDLTPAAELLRVS